MSMVEKLSYMKHLRGMTSEEIAKASGVPLGTVNKIFSGQTKNPAPKSLDRISMSLGVPIHYFLDDSIPTECSSMAYATALGFQMVSDRDMELISGYQALSDQGRQAVDVLIDILRDQNPAPNLSEPKKRLTCYVPVASGQQGTYGDGFRIQTLDACRDTTTEDSDFAIQLINDEMAPIHAPGTVLGVRRGPAEHNQLGVFLVNREGFVRKYVERKGLRKLQSVNLLIKDICLTPQDEVHCLGIVVGAIRNFEWVDTPNTKLLAGRV